MSSLAVVSDDVPTTEFCYMADNTLLDIASEYVEKEEAFLTELVAKEKPEDERAFRLTRRAEWRAYEHDKDNLYWMTSAEHVEWLRGSARRVVDRKATIEIGDYQRAAEFIELMRKIAS